MTRTLQITACAIALASAPVCGSGHRRWGGTTTSTRCGSSPISWRRARTSTSTRTAAVWAGLAGDHLARAATRARARVRRAHAVPRHRRRGAHARRHGHRRHPGARVRIRGRDRLRPLPGVDPDHRLPFTDRQSGDPPRPVVVVPGRTAHPGAGRLRDVIAAALLLGLSLATKHLLASSRCGSPRRRRGRWRNGPLRSDRVRRVRRGIHSRSCRRRRAGRAYAITCSPTAVAIGSRTG